MSTTAAIGLGVGALGALGGMLGSRAAARRQKRELEKQAARNEAWYNRNYYGDYLNSVEAMNAINRVRDTFAERARQARARSVVAGATPEMGVAETAAQAKGVAELMGNLAAQGDAYRRDVDARKQQMDAGISGARQAIAERQQGAQASLMSAGLNAVMNGLSQFDFGKKEV